MLAFFGLEKKYDQIKAFVVQYKFDNRQFFNIHSDEGENGKNLYFSLS